MSNLGWVAAILIALGALAQFAGSEKPTACCDKHRMVNSNDEEMIYCPVRDR